MAEDNATLGTFTTAITLNKVSRLRVTAIGNQLAVYWQTDFLTPNGTMPAITATDSSQSAGHVGLHSLLIDHPPVITVGVVPVVAALLQFGKLDLIEHTPLPWAGFRSTRANPLAGAVTP